MEELWAGLAAPTPAGGSTETASLGDVMWARDGEGTFIACHLPARPSLACWAWAGKHLGVEDVCVGFDSQRPSWCAAFPCRGHKDEATGHGFW